MVLKILKNEKGFSLPLVIVIFSVLMIFVTSALKISSNNAKQVQNQESNMRGYYVARSGIDIVYAALLKATDEDSDPNIIKFLADDNIDELKEEDIKVPKNNPIGTVDVTVSIVNDEVKIFAEAKVLDSGKKYNLALYFPKTDIDSDLNIEDTRWEKEN